ncbi:hypothetical protein [Nonomuraea recticatena]|uniref:Peroxidase n=1 Tax=Nonomuraea recticatena TaxID=46178 RepID=A0ABN3S4G3_9ACTN
MKDWFLAQQAPAGVFVSSYPDLTVQHLQRPGRGAPGGEDGRALAERGAVGADPEHDDPALGADPHRNNDFLYRENDDRGFRCPAGAHIRRANPRDATIIGDARMHRLIRRGATYGPPLPEGVLEDDGADRGLIGSFIGAYLERQFEFIKTEWVNDGNFIGFPGEKDPVAGHHDGTGSATIPQKPIRRRLQNLPSFVVTRGGEYCFMPGLRALRWLAELKD